MSSFHSVQYFVSFFFLIRCYCRLLDNSFYFAHYEVIHFNGNQVASIRLTLSALLFNLKKIEKLFTQLN